MRTLVSDTFAAYSDGALPTVSGGVYAQPSAWANPLAVVSHLVKGTTNGQDNACYLPGFSGSLVAQWAEVTIGAMSAFYGPSVFNDTVGNFYELDVAGSNQWAFYRMGGGYVNLLPVTTLTPTVIGDRMRLEVEVVGGDAVLRAYQNGGLLGTYTHAAGTKLVTGYPGMRIWEAGPAAFSKFEAGDFASAPVGGATLDDQLRLGTEVTAALGATPRLGGGFV